MLNLLTIAAAAFLAASSTTGVMVTPSQLTEFHKGEATYEQVVAKLGRPSYDTVTSDGVRIIAYVYAHAKIKGASFVPIVGLFAGGMKSETQTTSFIFEANGKMREWSSTGGQMDVGTGAAKPKP